MGAVTPNVLQPGAFVWSDKTQRPLMKVLPVPGWRPMKQFAACAFLAMWRASRRLVCRVSSEPVLRVNDIYLIHWSQHLITTQSEWPN
ncbi:hypothetical protein TNCV_4213541 [Trichonephila clavipes]|nr:hypothetical protein TNCV_4213541 [Trichonephila clavipes]